MPTLLVSVILIILVVRDPGIVNEFIPSPALYPAKASTGPPEAAVVALVQ